MESKIKISSSRGNEFYRKFKLGDDSYEVVTEDLGIKKAKVVTRIYLKGEILSSVTFDYMHLAKLPDLRDKLNAIMKDQHKSASETFIEQRSKAQKSKADYAGEIRANLKGSDKKVALEISREAIACFPSDPFFLSYCGYLTAVVENRSREGTKMCEDAIAILRSSKSADTVFFLPLFYLNLGRAYLKADKKAPAMDAFQEGLKYDSRNRDLLSALKSFGTRKKPVLPFLDRGNPLNRYLGKLRHDLQGRR